MSDNVIPFNNGQDEEPESCCPQCDLAHEYLLYVLESLENGTVDDLFSVLRGLVEESGKLALIDYLNREIGHSIALLDHLEGCCDEED